MNDNVIDVLIYLFENYLEEATELAPNDLNTNSEKTELARADKRLLDEDELSEELVESGFEATTVRRAINWLEGLQTLTEDGINGVAGGSAKAIRHYSGEEIERIDVESQGLLLSLERSGVIDPSIRELVIDRIMALESKEVDIDHVRWITMMILCNQTEHVHNLPLAEALVMDNDNDVRVH